MRESLSSNHFGHDNQLADVLNWLQSNKPSVFKSFLVEFPEWGEFEGDMAKVVEKLDPEWGMWATDWIEAATPIYWDDGEPWLGEEKVED